MDLVVGDALGDAMLSYLDVGEGGHVLERDDGWIESMDAGVYFRAPDEWPAGESRALELMHGRVLDIGAGAGRYSVALQEAGHDVIALDVSAGAVETCRRRGVESTFTGTAYELNDEDGFDTFLLGGHNLGLLESPNRAPRFVSRLGELARPGARIVGTCRSPLPTDNRDHLRYHEWNSSRGRSIGQMRFRVRRGRLATAWFDYWMMSPEELAEAVEPTAWKLIQHEQLDFGSYVGVLALDA
jgi:SAM-dependent methyltransferase